jgi:hypothetical protein
MADRRQIVDTLYVAVILRADLFEKQGFEKLF